MHPRTLGRVRGGRGGEGRGIPEENGLGLVVDAGFFEILEGGGGLLAPEILETVDLGEGDLAGAELLGLCGGLDEPGEEGAVVDEGGPEGGVPGDVLGYGGAGLSVGG